MTAEEPHESYVVRVNALLRYLLCVSPWRAEAIYYMANAAPPLNAQGWTCVVAGGHTGWIFIDRQAQTGAYSSTPPTLAPGASIPTIQVPSRYNVGLRTMADTLVAQVGGGAAHPALANLLDRLLAMGDGRFETAEVESFLQRCATPDWLPDGLAAYRDELLQGLCSARYPGYFVGLMLLLLKSIAGVERFALVTVLMSPQRSVHLMELLRQALVPMLVNEGPGRIERAAKELRSEGKAHLVQARKATRDEEFYGHLFRAGPLFHGAARGFELLAGTAQADAKEAWETADHECEEYLVCLSSSLINHFENLQRGWHRWQEHRQRVAQARTAKGQAAAELQAMHYLQVAYFYPESYRQPLLQGGLAPPEALGTAGGATLGKLCG